jgi:hypothetical protein
MNAYAAVLRRAHAPLAFQRAISLSVFFDQARAFAAAHWRSWPRAAVWRPTQRHGRPRSIAKVLDVFRVVPRHLYSTSNLALRNLTRPSAITWRLPITTWRLPITTKTGVSILLAGVAGAIAALAYVNNERSKAELFGVASAGNAFQLASAGNETIAFRQMSQPSFGEDEQDRAAADQANETALIYSRAVQTIRFVNAETDDRSGARGSTNMARVGAFVAFPGKQNAELSLGDAADWPANRRRKAAPNMDEVDRYLWEVYQRAPIKRDGSGDFTWKDSAAAQRMGLSLPEYAIGGMDPDFREQLYHAGRAMDAAGIQWSMLSAFRDDYRQGLAKGFKARVGNSLHGGTRATGGYGHGRAVDLTTADGEADVVWRWIDANGAKFGLHRPIPGPDPAHVQSRGDWHKLALGLRETRLRAADTTAQSAGAASKVAKASW